MCASLLPVLQNCHEEGQGRGENNALTALPHAFHDAVVPRTAAHALEQKVYWGYNTRGILGVALSQEDEQNC
jgi:hypothetical protein